MIKSEQKIKNLELLLKKNDESSVFQAVQMLREEEPFEGAVMLLAGHYDKNPGTTVRRAIEGFMNDMRDQSLKKEVMAEIKKKRNPETTKMLVSSCWQSGMDYSKYVNDFTGLFLDSDYGVAVECFSVIEESVPQLNVAQRTSLIEMIDRKTAGESNPKSSLVSALREIIEK